MEESNKVKENDIEEKETKESVEQDEAKQLDELYDKKLEKSVNVKEEDDPVLKPILQRLSNQEQAVFLSFIAPSYSKRISPVETRGASIRLWEELGIEKAILKINAELKNKKIQGKTNLNLLINSPGGLVSSSYVVAKMIRKSFGHIKVFIPNIAASGGTLLALVGNEIIMSELSRLSPIDTQLPYKDGVVSAQSYDRAIETFDDYFATRGPWEVPYPRKAMSEKFDPILWEEWKAELNQVWHYARNILTESGYSKEELNKIIYNLIFSPFPHEFVIDRDRARNILKLKVFNEDKYSHIWKVMKAWYSLYILEAEDRHFIRYVIFDPKDK